MSTWLTIEQMIQEYGISKRNQERLRQEKLIPYSKIGRLVRYNRMDIDQWLMNHKVAYYPTN
jgi:excisionase family DNA binding protein